MGSLKSKTVSGLFWTAIDSIGTNAIRMVVTVFLARLLMPSDFGLIAIFNVFIVISEALVHGGFSAALIRKIDADKKDFDTVFTFNLILSLVFYCTIYIISPFLASYFDQPDLNDIAKISGLVIIFNALGFIQYVHLRKSLNFRFLAVVNLVSSICSGIIGISLAYNGFGVWSLVVQLTSKSLFSSIILWLLDRKKVTLAFSYLSFKETFSFGYKISLANVINSLSRELYSLVIGKVYNAENLGYYYQGKRLSDITHKIISNIFNSVSYPALSSIQNDAERLNIAYFMFLRSVSFLSFPLMMCLIVIAPKLIILLMTDKWAQAIPYFQLLCFSGMLMPLIVISGNIPMVKGRSDITLKIELLYKIIMLVALMITVWISVYAIVIGIVIQVIIQFFINFYYVSRFLSIPMIKQLKSISDIFVISLIIASVTYTLRYFEMNDLIILIAQIMLFCILYLITNILLKNNELRHFYNMFKDRFRGR